MRAPEHADEVRRVGVADALGDDVHHLVGMKESRLASAMRAPTIHSPELVATMIRTTMVVTRSERIEDRRRSAGIGSTLVAPHRLTE
jgi:hypothetical protein